MMASPGPDDADVLIWDEANEQELARHGLRPRDVEELLEEEFVWIKNKTRTRKGDAASGARSDGIGAERC